MAPSAFVALCLLALASAAPQNLQNLQCASSCDMTRQATVGDIGKTYTYSYNVQSTINIAGVKDATSQGQMLGTVHVSRINPCEVAIKFTGNDETANMNKYPLVVSIPEKDNFGKVCAHQDDDSESVNMKKAIASAFVYSLPTRETTTKKIITEKSVLGTCPTAYSVKKNGEIITVNKEIIHSECQDHAYSHSDIPSILSKSPMPVQVSKSMCQQIFSSEKVPQTITCKDTKVIRPAYGTYKYIEALQESTLEFISESTDLSVPSLIEGSKLLTKKWSHEHSMPAKNPALVGKLDSVLRNVCSMVQGQGHQDAASYVNEAIELLEHVPEDAFVTVVNKIRAGEYCTDFSKLEALFMDAIAFIGEPGAVKVMAQEVSAGRVTDGRLALYTAALHLMSKPSANHVAAVTPIAAMENPSSTLTLAAASVVNKYCKLVKGCENTAAVKNILNLLVGKLETQCTPSFSNINSVAVMTTLKALGNIGYMAPQHADKVVKCAKTEAVEVNVRFAAAMALKGTPCMTSVKNTLLAAALDMSMNTEVRIGSYLAAIRCVEASDIQEIITKMNAESNIQVKSFVFTHLSNLKETNWPLKEHLHKFLSNVNIPSTYQSNIFKYSKNIEMSYNTPVLGLGAAVDSNVVYERDSYLPRLVNLGLDMNLLGSFINIGEVGARVEGLDPIIKEAFGPESYLYKTPLKEIVQDSSLFIKQNGAGLYKQLEKLIKQKGSFDVNAVMQSVSKFLMANNIKLPKTDLYAKLMGQEYAFLSVAGPMQEVNFNNIIETITSAVVDTLVATKDLNIDTARAAHLHIDYSIPTIQGIPLMIKLLGTAVTGIKALSKLESKAKAHDAIVKIIPSLSIAIDGHIGYGAATKHGLKMKNSVYSTNGFALYATLKHGQDLEVKLELPEKMELINVKSEVYLMTGNKMMDDVKISTNAINDPRITEHHCSNLVEHITGLHVCYDVNIPNVISSKSLPLGLPVSFKVYLQKSDTNMKGYRIQATLKNKVDKKVLKMVAGTYGSAASAESSAKFTYTKEGNTYLTAVDIKSAWLASNVEATFAHATDLVSLQLKADYKLNFGSPVAVACKFDIKNEKVANVKQYQISGYAGLTKSLTETHKFLNVKLSLMLNGGYTNAKLLANIETLFLPINIGVELDVPRKSPWLTVVHKAELKVATGKAIAFDGLILRKGAGQYLNSMKILYYGSNVMKIEATHAVTGKVFESFSFITKTQVMIGSQEIGTTFTIKHENSVIDTIWELRNAGANIFSVNLKHTMEAKLYTTTIEVALPTLPKTLKVNNVIEVLEFLNYKLITVVNMDNSALAHIEGPVSCQFGNAMMKYNIDLKISGAFDGTIKFMNAALFSLAKTQFTIDMRHATTPLVFVDILADRTNAAETTAKAVIHLPIVLKAEYAASISSGLIHTSMNTFILPTTSMARRFKGYADLNLKEQMFKADLYWDAEKDTNKKLSLTTGYMVDVPMRKILVQGDLTLSTLTYGYKLETLLASPFEWFIGTSGIEVAVTAPSKKVFLTKALFTVEHAESLVIFKPLLALETLNENKYEISGSLAAKKLPALLNFDISSQLTITVPEMNKISVANKFLHEDKDGSCTITFKTGITGLYEPISLEISHEATVKGYSTLVKIDNGASVSIVSSKIALITGIKAIDITIDATLQTLNENKYAISGSLAAKKLPALLTFDISSQLTITVPGMKKISFVNKFLHEDKDGSCTFTFKTGITGIYEPISLEISHEATVKGYTTLVKIDNGASVSIVSSKIVLITGLKAFDITIDATLPFTSVKSLAIRATKTAEGTATIMFSKNQLVLAKLHYIMASIYTHTISFECPSRTIEVFASFNGNEMTVKVFPEKTLSTKMLEVIVRLTKKTGSANIECFITAPSLANELKIAAELALADPAKENLMSVNVQFPLAEFKTLVNAVVVELQKIYGDLVKDGLLPDIAVLLNKLELLIRELPKYVNALQIQFLEIFTKYLNFVRNWAMKMWKLYEADVIAFLKNVQVELMHCWTILKIEVPIIFNDFMVTLKKTELWKMLHGLVNEIIKRFPAHFNILVDFYNKVVLTAMKMWKLYEADVIAFLKNVQVELMHYWTILKIEVPIIFNDFMVTLMKTELWKMLHGLVNEIINHFPAHFNILVDFYNKVVLTAVAEIKNVVHKMMALPTFNFEGVRNILKSEVPAVVANLTTQLLNTELVTVIVGKVKEFIAHFPTAYKAVVDFWTHVIVPAYTDVVTMLNKLMKIQFTNVSVMITVFVEEILTVFNNFMTRVMNCEVVQMIITNVKKMIKANPFIETLYAAVLEVCNKTLVALRDDLVMFYKRLMNFPMIKKLVDYILQIFHSKDIRMAPLTWKSFTTVVHVFVTDVLGMTYTIAGNHFSTVVALPCSVSTLNNIWTSATTYLSAVVADVVNTWITVTESFPVAVATFKKHVFVMTEFIVEQIPITVKAIKSQVPKLINDLLPIINNFIEFLMNTEVFRFLMVKIEEVITMLMVKIEEVIIMYPAEFNAVKEFVEKFIQFTFVTYNKMMEIPVIKKIVDYIWQLINRKDLHSSMVSSMSSVSSSVSSYTSSISSNVPLFVKLHTSSALSSWLASLAQ